MIKADYKDKELIVNILTSSFDDNKSVNYIIEQDNKRAKRLRNLMEYSFDVCYLFGEVFLTDNKKGCALIVLPDKKKITPKSILSDAKLAVSCVGLFNIKKALARLTALSSKTGRLHLTFPPIISTQAGCPSNGRTLGGCNIRRIQWTRIHADIYLRFLRRQSNFL